MTAEFDRIPGHNDVALAFDRDGDRRGRGVILLHGGGQTRHAWRKLFDTLAVSGHDVLSTDLRGHGDSGWAPDGDYSLSAFAADVLALVAHMDKPVVIVGASQGGLNALLAASESAGGNISALVLVDISIRIKWEGAKQINAFMHARPDGFADLQDAADSVAAYLPQRTRPLDPEGLRKNLRQRPDGRLIWHWDPAYGKLPDKVSFAKQTERLERAATRVAVPTLLIRGTMSSIIGTEEVAALSALMPTLQVAEVSGASHMLSGDRNDEFADIVTAFLNNLPAEKPERASAR